MKNFGLIGAAGYIAPRHMQAIKANNARLVAALDPSDSVGILDSYFPDAHFFTEFERFDRHIDKLRRQKSTLALDYLSVCSPNYLHDSHVRFAMRSNCDVICEKPLVLNPWNIDALQQIERETGRKVNTILQLRLHPNIQQLKQKVATHTQKKFDVDLTYITSRGNWYLQSWKGDIKKSGGIATNIGVHFFDMLHFVFGKLQTNRLHYNDDVTAAGFLEYEHARVRWFLSIDQRHLPEQQQLKGQRTFRSVLINNTELEFSDGFADLHTLSYQHILAGNGFGLEENKIAITTVSDIRQATIENLKEDYHPLLHKFVR